MIRLLVCSGRVYDDEAVVFKTLDTLAMEYGGIVVNAWGSEGVGKCARKWCRLHLAIYDEFVLFGRSCDLVVAFYGAGSNAGVDIPLRQAWKKRIPALRINADGSHVKIGVGWKTLLQQRRRRLLK